MTTRAEAMAAAAQVLADAIAENAETYEAHGAMGVADAAWLPGGPSREELAAHYESILRPARPRSEAA